MAFYLARILGITNTPAVVLSKVRNHSFVHDQNLSKHVDLVPCKRKRKHIILPTYINVVRNNPLVSHDTAFLIVYIVRPNVGSRDRKKKHFFFNQALTGSLVCSSTEPGCIHVVQQYEVRHVELGDVELGNAELGNVELGIVELGIVELGNVELGDA
jgi:hypothetical protein